MTRRWLGRWLVLAGVAASGVSAVLALTGHEPAVEDFLPYHLAGVIPGSILSRWESIRRVVRRPARDSARTPSGAGGGNPS